MVLESLGQGEGTEHKSSPTLCREPERDCGGRRTRVRKVQAGLKTVGFLFSLTLNLSLRG